MLDLNKLHEEINSRFEETEPQDGDIAFWPNEEIGVRFVYVEDHWEHQEE